MVVSPPHLPHLSMIPNSYKRRRTATAVMAGLFDPRPARFVLTSVLNGVPPYKEVEGDAAEDEEQKAKKRLERKEQKRAEKKLAKQLLRAKEKELRAAQQQNEKPDSAFASGSTTVFPASAPVAGSSSDSVSSSQWRTIARPTIHIPAQPSASVTPSPTSSPRRMPSTPGTTPGPSISSSTSRTSSKRPLTPDEEEEHAEKQQRLVVTAPEPPRERKKRQAAKKGWKGWVEGSPPPSEKLINLDSAPVLQERRLRSGKNFDGVGPGGTRQGWV